MISQQEAKNLIDKVIGYSKLPGCQIDLYWTEDVFIRFANNGITTSGYRVASEPVNQQRDGRQAPRQRGSQRTD